MLAGRFINKSLVELMADTYVLIYKLSVSCLFIHMVFHVGANSGEQLADLYINLNIIIATYVHYAILNNTAKKTNLRRGSPWLAAHIHRAGADMRTCIEPK